VVEERIQQLADDHSKVLALRDAIVSGAITEHQPDAPVPAPAPAPAPALVASGSGSGTAAPVAVSAAGASHSSS
jgi:hypothetical protein